MYGVGQNRGRACIWWDRIGGGHAYGETGQGEGMHGGNIR